MPKVAKEEVEVPLDRAKGILTRLIKENPKLIWNRKESFKFKVSTGSLALDIVTGGGINGGTCLRVVGPPNQGKTSELLEIVRNLFKVRPKARAVYVDAEGRLSENIQKRSGLNFTNHEDNWANHSVFILETNVYDKVADAIIELILTNSELPPDEQEQYAFIIDSLDCLILQSDLEKSLTESYKVAGPQVVTKKLMQRISLPLHKGGHLGLFTSQMTAAPSIGGGAPDYRMDGGSGGNAIRHAVDNIWEFQPRYQKNHILEKPLEKYDPIKNKILGHSVDIIIKKSDNEKNNVKVSYSILDSRWGGNSIWKEREVGDQMIASGWVIKSASWLKFEPEQLKAFRTIEPEFPEQIQGMNGLYQLLEEYPAITNHAYDQFLYVLSQENNQEVVME